MAYEELSSRSKDVEYKGRGIVGVVDKVLFGTFTSKGAGRPVGTKRIKMLTNNIMFDIMLLVKG